MLAAFAAGFSLSLSLILVLGPQNAHVLRMGLLRQHVAITVFACGLTDAALIAIGVAGLGKLLALSPMIETVIVLVGVLFLLVYGWRAARQAFQASSKALASAASTQVQLTPAKALSVALGFSWLNPHAWLDTTVLIGTASVAYATPANWWFGFGAATGSMAWFMALGFGAKALAPWLAKPNTWRFVDGLIAITMWVTAGLLTKPLIWRLFDLK